MPDRAAAIASKLAEQAEAVCRHYLSNGRREGRYWLVGDADNTPGRSLFVRLKSAEAAKPAGKWTDAATGEHGDLLDIVARRERLTTLRETLDEARRFLALPRVEPTDTYQRQLPAPTGSPEAARRLFAMSKPIAATLAETYLHERGITGARICKALCYHPRCWYRSDDDDPADHVRDSWPALIAAVTDDAGVITGAHRTWLDPSGRTKAPVSTPRRAMGLLLGNGVRFGKASDVLAAGEGIETILSLRCVLPAVPMIAALSANHLAALLLPNGLRRLYIARDNDPAGRHAAEMRRMGSRTQHDYVRHVRAFAGFLARSPDTATAEDVRQFQLHQREHGVGEGTINGSVSALRFLFGVTLDRADLSRRLVLAHRPRKLPDVLSVDEVAKLLEAAPGIKYRAALGVAYGAGLRVSEVAHLKADDIDSKRMLIRIEEGKGRKDRNAMLSPQLLELLRLWWREGKRRSVLLPHGWLFPGRSYTDPISTRQLHRAVCEAADAAGIRKRVSPHTLRHSFATHLLEQDVDIRVIQVLLGHSKLETTALYTKVATRTIRAVTSPLDRLMALMEGKTPAG